MSSSTRTRSSAAKVKEAASVNTKANSGKEAAIRSPASLQSAAELKKAQKESDERASRVKWEFQHMGNKYYKDPDAQLETASVSDTSSTSSLADSTDALTMPDNTTRHNAPSSSRRVKMDHDPLAEIIERQTRAYIMIVKNDVADFFKGALGGSPQLYIRQGNALGPDKSLLVYSEDAGNMVELFRALNISVRDTLRALDMAPEDEASGVHTDTKTGPSPPAAQTGAKGSLRNKRTKVAVRIVLGIASRATATAFAAVVSIACGAAALAICLAFAFDPRGVILAAAFCALRFVDALQYSRNNIVRHICTIAHRSLVALVEGLLKLRDEFGKVAAEP